MAKRPTEAKKGQENALTTNAIGSEKSALGAQSRSSSTDTSNYPGQNRLFARHAQRCNGQRSSEGQGIEG